MSADLEALEAKVGLHRNVKSPVTAESDANDRTHEADEKEKTENSDNSGDNDDDDDEEEEEEPKLKYAKLTGSLANVYRNGDSTAAFLVAGDKMIAGTHNGSIHVMALPTLQSLRTYRAHQASVTCVSVSPVPPPPSTGKSTDSAPTIPTQGTQSSATTRGTFQLPNRKTTGRPQQPQISNTPNNQIYIATSSLDGHVCVSSLVNPDDVQLRNFARPVNAVALSPSYKSDRTYLSGGLAGNLILTVGGRSGVTTNANTNSAAAAASGFLDVMGLGGNAGRDTILHSGEGAISCIKWSLSGKWVVWVNEEGIKIMRSHLKLGSEDSEDAWKRIAHAARPAWEGYEEMAGVWKARCEWIDDKSLESDDSNTDGGGDNNGAIHGASPAKSTTRLKGGGRVEKLVVGWGDTAWLLHVTPASSSAATDAFGKRQIGSVDLIHKLHFLDCVVSGISFYTPSFLAILAYRTRDDNDQPIVTRPLTSTNTKANEEPTSPRKSRQHKHNGIAPQLRLVNVANGEELEVDELPMSRFEMLSSQDYHFGTIYMPPPSTVKANNDQQRGALETIWDSAGGGYASRMFSSSASVFSARSDGKEADGRTASLSSPKVSSGKDVTASPDLKKRAAVAHPYLHEPGLKLFIQSPYDCVLAAKRDTSDHLDWLLESNQYEQAWNIIDEHPEAAGALSIDLRSLSSPPASPIKTGDNNQPGTLAEFLADDSSSQATGVSGVRAHYSIAQKEKRRIAELWLQQLISADRWTEAGKVAAKVLETSHQWENWVWTFVQAEKFDEITPYIPSTGLKPSLPSTVYEVVLGHYIAEDRTRLSQLLEVWDLELFDGRSVISAIKDKMESGDVSEESVEDSVQGRDWRILMDALAKLYLSHGQTRQALKCYIRLQDAEKAFALIRDEKLADTVAEDVPGLVMLRVSQEQVNSGSLKDLEESSSEAIQMLVHETRRGAVSTNVVVRQLEKKGDKYQPFVFFYLRALWTSSGLKTDGPVPRRGIFANRLDESHGMVNDHADLAVRLFAQYDRSLLLDFLRNSSFYSYETAAEICERRHFIPEQVHILSKIGQTKRALFLIIDELGDVGQAISFTKEHPDLWDDLLEYSMNKPSFIRGLLEEVGAATAFNPIDVVRRIPEGLEIEGLKQGIHKLIREFEIQLSISGGVAQVLRSEVATGMDELRAGRRKGMRFEVVHETPTDVQLSTKDVQTKPDGNGTEIEAAEANEAGHCVDCGLAFHEDGKSSVPLTFLLLGRYMNSNMAHRRRDPHRLRLWPRLPFVLSARRKPGHA